MIKYAIINVEDSDNMEMEKEEKIIFSFVLLFIFIGTIGFSYGYFRAEFAYSSDAIEVTTGTLELKYSDDSPLIYKNNFKPGETIIKTITVENTGTLDAVYDLIWKEYKNEITNDELTISAVCDSMNFDDIMSGSCTNIEEKPISEDAIKTKVSISPGMKHRYNIVITFKNLDEIQNYNQGKTFSAIINVKDSNMSITFENVSK